MCVLMVEDEPLILMSVAQYLEDAGYEVMTAEHGREALRMIEQSPVRFTILVTDYHMPHGVTGGQLVQHMRLSYPDIPMLITTALTGEITAEFCKRHGLKVMTKPYDPDILVAMVGWMLGHAVPG